MATTKFEKDQLKLMANAVFGKFIEDVTKHMKAILCLTPTKFQRLAAHPNYAGSLVVNKDLTIVFHKLKEVVITKPIAIGFSILEISKNYMYIAYYDCFKNIFNDSRVLFSDTDSFILSIKSSNLNIDLYNAKHLMDFSNYPTDHPLFNLQNQNKLGFFKDEFCSRLIAEFIGIRAKCYALKSITQNNEFTDKRLCKGIESSAVKQYLPYSKYRESISSISSFTASMNRLTSKNHQLLIQCNSKIAFSSFDSKRYLFNCGIHSVPYGSIEITPEGNCPFDCLLQCL